MSYTGGRLHQKDGSYRFRNTGLQHLFTWVEGSYFMTPDFTALSGGLEIIWNRIHYRFIDVLCPHLPGGTEKNHKNLIQDSRCPCRKLNQATSRIRVQYFTAALIWLLRKLGANIACKGVFNAKSISGTECEFHRISVSMLGPPYSSREHEKLGQRFPYSWIRTLATEVWIL
jgi:hypothetical protein